MMKYIHGILAAILTAFLCSGCNQLDSDTIDSSIPAMKTTDTYPADTMDTKEEHVSVCDAEHEQKSDPLLEAGYSYEAYEDTYEGSLQNIYDVLYRMIDDINLLKGTDQYREEYSAFLLLMNDAVDGHVQKNVLPPATVHVKGTFAYYNYDGLMIRLFEKYPQQAAEETALIEVTRYFCYLYSVNLQGSTEKIYADDALYYALFPHTENILTDTNGAKTLVTYEGYTGEIVAEPRAVRFNSLRGGENLFSDTAEIVNYTGTVSVAPVNPYGATGRTSHIYVHQDQDDSIITSIYINGDRIMINPDITSQEYIDMLHQKEPRSVKESYLDSIDNVPYLSVLQVSHCELSDTSLLFSRIPMNQINTLDLSNNDLEVLDVSSFSSLDSLDLHGNDRLHSIEMPDRRSILYLNLRGTSIASLDFLSEYETIAAMDIRETAVPDLTSLADKTVYSIDIDADCTDCSGLQNMKNLKSLNIVSGEELSGELLDLVKKIDTIHEFYYNNQVVPLT